MARNYSDSKAVDNYINSQNDQNKEKIQKIREVILAQDNRIVERICYGWPTFRLHKDLCSIAGFKNHITFFIMDHQIVKDIKNSNLYQDLEYLEVSIKFSNTIMQPNSLFEDVISKKIFDQETQRLS